MPAIPLLLYPAGITVVFVFCDLIALLFEEHVRLEATWPLYVAVLVSDVAGHLDGRPPGRQYLVIVIHRKSLVSADNIVIGVVLYVDWFAKYGVCFRCIIVP